MNYQQANDYLDSLTRFGWKLGLERMRLLAHQLGDPQDRVPAIHISGTSGKGSTCEMIGRILQSAGYRTGIYASPHVYQLTERYRINGEMITPEQFAELVTEIRPLADATVNDPELGRTTVFEIMTLAAFELFLREKVDFSILEVGLGGRYDATNIISNPLASGITSISLDHTDRLGKTVEEIASDKAGIVKPNGILVTGADQPGVISIFKETCQQQNAQLLRVDHEIQLIDAPNSDLFDVQCSNRRYSQLRSGMLGSFQHRNAAVAVGIVDTLIDKGYSISEEAVRNGLAAAQLPGRLQVIRRNPTIVFDGAHNQAKAKALASSIQELFTYDRLILVLGMLSNHSAQGVAAELAPLAHTIIVTAPNSERAATPESVADAVRPYNPNIEIISNPQDALKYALTLCTPNSLLLTTGSFYTLGDINVNEI